MQQRRDSNVKENPESLHSLDTRRRPCFQVCPCTSKNLKSVTFCHAAKKETLWSLKQMKN